MISGSFTPISSSSPDDSAWTWQATTSEDDGWKHRTWLNNTDATEKIHLDLDWLTVLGHGTGSHQIGNYSFFKKVREVCSGTSALESEDLYQVGQMPDILCMASEFSLGIGEGLSKIPYNFDVYALGFTEDATYGHPAFPMTMSPWTSTFGFKFGNPWKLDIVKHCIIPDCCELHAIRLQNHPEIIRLRLSWCHDNSGLHRLVLLRGHGLYPYPCSDIWHKLE